MTTTNQRAVELAPCPFCGSNSVSLSLPTCTKDSPYNPRDRAFPVVMCGCGVEMPGNNWDQHGISAIAAWNRRAPGWRPISEEQVEAAARLIAVINNGHPDYTPQETVAAFWNLLDTDQQDRYRRMARAALSTLPPPGEAK